MDRATWLAWRVDRIGASECPKLMGIVRDGRLALWEKLCYKNMARDFQGDAMKFGNIVEQALVEMVCRQYGASIDCQAIYICDQFDRLHATVDGSFEDPITGETIIVECKARSYEAVAALSSNKIPDDIFLQCQQQMLCSGASMCIIAWTDRLGASVKTMQLAADLEVHAEIVRQAQYMYDCVEKLKQPEPFLWSKKMSDSERNDAIKDLVAQLKALQPSEQEVERANQLKLVEQQLKDLCSQSGGALCCDGVSVKESTRVGSVRYDRIDVLQGIDLSQYRGEPVKTYKISITG